MPDETAENLSPAAQRLCSEIQLFDLCDLDSCRFKSSRFCTNEQLLSKFEAIKEEDDRSTLLYEEDEGEEEVDSESDFDELDDSVEDDEDF
jgi:hypothetical protein